jgi:transcription elongation factor GreA
VAGGRPASNNGASSPARQGEAPIEMTADGLTALKAEIEGMESQRADLVRSIEVARQDGDLRENAPYHAAREALAFHEQRMRTLNESLRRAVVVDRVDDDRSAVGSTVTVTNLDEEKQFNYTLVSAREANAAERKISVDSPVGRQLLGKRPGDEVRVETPRGEIKFRVDAVAQQ